MFEVGDKVQHVHNRDLGPGEVVAVEGGRMRVRFPRVDETLEFRHADAALEPLRLEPGADPERWAEAFEVDVVDRLCRLDLDPHRAWENRLEGLRLARMREASGLGSFLGGRVAIFPHQLHVAEQATALDPVRWLLADEVGLGKTVEACLILNRLLHTRRAERVVVVAPASLTVQWLGELYRKFHQTFVLLDRDRLRDVARDFGPEWNPFEVHPRSVVALEDLVDDPKLGAYAVAASPDLLVVDEAHRLERRPGHPGSPAYRALAPVARAATHALLLSATPLEADAHGFFRLLQLLRPDMFPSWDAFRADLDAGRPIVPCASATRREDIGGLPPRVPRPVPMGDFPELVAAEATVLAQPAGDRLQRVRRAEALERALGEIREDDPRVAWIQSRLPGWTDAGEKILVFVHRRETLVALKRRLEGTSTRIGVFHEELSPAGRDLEVAEFARPEGPTLLISTESGGEGRNFEFVKALVLFDLPWDPVLVEQRIGRLDRISRTRPVETRYFVPAEGFGREVALLYEELGIFEAPLGGLDRSLGHIRDAVRGALDGDRPRLDVTAIVAETHAARQRINRALYRDLHRHRYRADLAAGILARIPEGLEALTASVVLEACRQYGFETLEKPGDEAWYVEFGAEAIVDALSGVREGGRWLGTFDRAEAVRRETLDFFASGHELVEAVLHEIEEGRRGQVALLDIPGAPEDAFGFALLLRRPDGGIEAQVLDLEGRSRPEWVEMVLGAEAHTLPATPESWGLSGPAAEEVWAGRVRSVLGDLARRENLLAGAGFRLVRAEISIQ
jgi:ATP-dependent helicase HepA